MDELKYLKETRSEPLNSLQVYSIVVLHHDGRYLLLHRSPTRAVLPNRWLGMGGRVESNEFSDLRSAALRELQEESGIDPSSIKGFRLRYVTVVAYPGEPLKVLLYYTGGLGQMLLPMCPEGTLAWIAPEEIPALDIVENVRPVLALLFDDQVESSSEQTSVRLGVAHYFSDGTFDRLVWA